MGQWNIWGILFQVRVLLWIQRSLMACTGEHKRTSSFFGTNGLLVYYRKFVKHYGSLARPLTDLIKKDAFLWNNDAQQAFESLKSAMVTAPVLALPDFNLPFVVECDASDRGIGAVLMQQQQPIAYYSKALSDRNLAKLAYEWEIMASVLAVQHWRSYLLGTTFIVYTDQKSQISVTTTHYYF